MPTANNLGRGLNAFSNAISTAAYATLVGLENESGSQVRLMSVK